MEKVWWRRKRRKRKGIRALNMRKKNDKYEEQSKGRLGVRAVEGGGDGEGGKGIMVMMRRKSKKRNRRRRLSLLVVVVGG